MDTFPQAAMFQLGLAKIWSWSMALTLTGLVLVGVVAGFGAILVGYWLSDDLDDSGDLW